VCSFPACRNGGVKFLYCLHCKGAIARRNFRSSHAHKDSCKETQHSYHEDSSSLSTAKFELEPSDENPNKRLKQSMDDEGLGVLATAATCSSSPATVANDETPHAATGTQNAGSKSWQQLRRISKHDELKAQWNQLLEDRRKCKSSSADDLSNWLNKVMAVSNEFVGLPSKGKSTTDESTEAYSQSF
jgi:hypothetical protein